MDEQWVVVVTFKDGGRRYWAGQLAQREWDLSKGNARRFPTEAEASRYGDAVAGSWDKVQLVEAERVESPRSRFGRVFPPPIPTATLAPYPLSREVRP